MPILEAACLSHNSKIAVYYHFLTSGRFSAYRPKLSREDILSLPIPPPTEGLLKGIENYSKLDNFTFDLFGLKDAERVLIEDTVEYKLDDLIRGNRSKGRQSTTAGESNEDEAHMRSYCSYFLRVLKAGFGSERAVTATIYRCQTESVPYRLVAFALGQNSYNEIEIKDIRSNSLLSELDRMNHLYKNANGGIYKNRNVRIYEVIKDIPTVVVIKPDQKRFWTRSMGLQDGDEVALDIFKWQQLSHQEDDRKMH